MIVFDKLEDALEEAKFCAEDERRKYIVKPRYNIYQVFPKYKKGVRIYRHIEVGFKRELAR